MAPKVPTNLQSPKRATTIQQQKIIKQYGSLQNYQNIQSQKAEEKRVTDINNELQKFQQGLTYDNYQSRYNSLSPDAKAAVTSPSQIRSSQSYKDYQKQVAQANAYNAWVSKAIKTQKKYGFIPTTIPPSLRGTQYENEIKRIIETQRRIDTGYYAKINKRQLETAMKESGQTFGTISPGYAEKNLMTPAPTETSIIPQQSIAATQDLRFERAYQGEIQPAPGLVSGIVQKFKSERQVYDKTIVESATGTFGSVVEGGVYRASGDTQTAKAAGRAAEVAPFFAGTFGAGLLVAQGTEQLSPRRLEARKEEYIQSGVPQGISSILSIGVPAAEVGLGLFGLRGVAPKPKIPRVKSPGETLGLGKPLVRGKKGQSGSSQYTEVVTATGERRFIKKKDLEDFLNREIRSGNKVKVPGKGLEDYAVKAERARLLIRSAKSQEGRNEALKIIREQYGDDFLKEFAQQEFGFVLQSSSSAPQETATIARPQGRLSASPRQTLKASNRPRLSQSQNPLVGNRVRQSVEVKPKITTVSKTDSVSKQNIAQAVTGISAQASSQDRAQQPALAVSTLFDTSQSPDVSSQTAQQPALSLTPRLTTPQSFDTPTDLLTGRPTPPQPRRPEPSRPRPRVPPIRIGFPEFEGKKRTRTDEQIGYQVEVKQKGRYRKVSNDLFTREGAKDFGARVVDNSTSADFRIVPVPIERKSSKTQSFLGFVTNNMQAPVRLRSGDGYFALNDYKFKNYQNVKGKRKPLNNRYIEKKNKRIDTRGEKEGLSASAFIARRRKSLSGNGKFRL